MKISILTTITNPIERQDKWKEAIANYSDFADEVVVVCGTQADMELSVPSNVILIYCPWPYEWNWIELPRHLNAGLEKCSGDWVMKMDIDQFIHENDFEKIRALFSSVSADCELITFQKMSFVCKGKHFEKGPTPIAFRRSLEIKIGEDESKRTDLCFPIRQTGVKVIYEAELRDIPDVSNAKKINDLIPFYELPIGKGLVPMKGSISYWNYDYCFKTKEFTRKEFYRFSRAYYRYFKSWEFGETEEDSFNKFIEMEKGRYSRCPYETKPEDHPKYIRQVIKDLTPEQFGYNGWGLI